MCSIAGRNFLRRKRATVRQKSITRTFPLGRIPVPDSVPAPSRAGVLHLKRSTAAASARGSRNLRTGIAASRASTSLPALLSDPALPRRPGEIKRLTDCYEILGLMHLHGPTQTREFPRIRLAKLQLSAPSDGTERRPQSGSYVRAQLRAQGPWGCEPATGICASPPCSRDWSNLLCTPIRCTSARRGEPVAATIGPVVDACGHQCIRRKLRRERAGDRVVGALHF